MSDDMFACQVVTVHMSDYMFARQVVTVQMIDRNVIHASRWLENRWLITVNSAIAKFKLIRTGMRMLNKTVSVRAYDDVVTEEYYEYQVRNISS